MREILEANGVSPITGFIPDTPPLEELPQQFAAVTALSENLAKLLEENSLRENVQELPVVACHLPLEEAVAVLRDISMLAAGYLHQGEPLGVLPAALAVPLNTYSEQLGRTPTFTYDLFAPRNFRVNDPSAPFDIENLDVLRSFTGTEDERVFTATHIACEAALGPAIYAIGEIQEAITKGDQQSVEKKLCVVHDGAQIFLRRFAEGVASQRIRKEVFNKIRPFLQGFENITYLGTPLSPRVYRGETAAQMPSIHYFDLALGLRKQTCVDDDMQQYIPPHFRVVLDAVQEGPSITSYVHAQGGVIQDTYDSIADVFTAFRKAHISVVRGYSPSAQGTGSTEGLSWLEGRVR
ncbi:MAG: hypothetical protein OXR66_07560 [Candidatus Woesearchaeota archaeon]|nr:hypothetical protein [Candidatus Woesearchaeota archaeon]